MGKGCFGAVEVRWAVGTTAALDRGLVAVNLDRAERASGTAHSLSARERRLASVGKIK